MTISEGAEVRLLRDAVGLEGHVIPAGTVGTVVDATHAPGQYAVDVADGDRYDNVAVSADEIEVLDRP
jgi:hypothetical protein